ncbi:hypothetical protein GNP81_10165 [Aliivibrio fischeri]|uniref:DUF6575 domain-containing protein n=1 Tax=Aliivibrio fischeri TaxID=668 RepID=UPI0012D9F49D|nr:DUF6575 domain-containing protein [Aliivibrio fischeri]MUK63279.1 hypothetical protein [Aliivibrio fischeri]MUL20104.1 hypothetical protein [Aliivibrio fischeri]MUL24967.1 hypothetical protein [Aliivibrio fischeri]
MDVLPNNTVLGKLRFFEIYDDFLGPKCFSVKDELDSLYLVYWSGDYDGGECTKWIYMPISQKKLDELLREESTFHQAFAESKRLMVMSVYSEANSKANVIEPFNIHAEVNLPPEKFSIDIGELQSIAPESKWDFNLRIAKKSKGETPNSNVVTKVIDAFNEIIELLMKDNNSKKRPSVHPLSAVYGSFDMKLGTSDHARATIAIEQLGALLSAPNLLEENLKNLELDPYRLKDLLDIVNLHKLELTLKPKTSELLKEPVVITSSALLPIIKKLESSTVTFIDSNKVPQANDLDRVIDIVKIRCEGDELHHEIIDGVNSERQVEYYTHAARCLGLLNNNLTIASAGRALCHKSSRIAQYQFLADRVESSDFGCAWMKWSGVTDIGGLDPSTSEQFIAECVKGLQGQTVKRRANSLRTWLTLLKQYRRAYDDVVEIDN